MATMVAIEVNEVKYWTKSIQGDRMQLFLKCQYQNQIGEDPGSHNQCFLSIQMLECPLQLTVHVGSGVIFAQGQVCDVDEFPRAGSRRKNIG